MRPNDLPPIDHYPHGSRARYVAGCRCEPCTNSNREYARLRGKLQRQGEWNGLVDSSPARTHLKWLSSHGIGLRSVSAAADVGKTVLVEISSGRHTKIRAMIAKKILSVDLGARADASLVPAAKTWKKIEKLLRYETKTELARELGSKALIPALQVGRKMVLASTAQKVSKLYRRLVADLKREESLSRICAQCGFSHEKSDRQQYLRHTLPNKVEEIKEAWPCIYGGISGERQLFRDLKDIGAAVQNNIWTIQRRPTCP